MDSLAQTTGNWWQLSPSVFLRARAKKSAQNPVPGFFRCPICHAAALAVTAQPSAREQVLTCQHCRHGWSLANGIYDFKTPVVFP
jgi:transcription elongation factor Elf1